MFCQEINHISISNVHTWMIHIWIRYIRKGNWSLVSTAYYYIQHDDVHQRETFSTLLALCVGNSPLTGEFPAQRPVAWSFSVFMFCTWINGWVRNRVAGELRCYRTHYDVIVMSLAGLPTIVYPNIQTFLALMVGSRYLYLLLITFMDNKLKYVIYN